MRVFIDANIFIDIFNVERLYHKSSLECYRYLIQNKFTIYTSCDLITTIYYIEAKRDKREALLTIDKIVKTLEIIEFSNKEITEVCNLMQKDSDFRDLEDTLQYILAKKVECNFIITNDKSFISKDIEIIHTKEFCEKFMKKS